MRTWLLLQALLTATLAAGVARGEVAEDDPLRAVDVSPLEALTVQDRQVLKTLDTFAGQRLSLITGKRSLDGMPPVWTLMDIAHRPGNYVDREIIKIHHLPLRLDLAEMPGLSAELSERIRTTGRVSGHFLSREDVQEMLIGMQQADLRRSEPINRLLVQAGALQEIVQSPLMPGAMLPPPDGGATDVAGAGDAGIWRNLDAALGNAPTIVAGMRANGIVVPEPLEGYDPAAVDAALIPTLELGEAWRRGEVADVQAAVDELAAALPAVVPEVYPSQARRATELWYNKLGKGTLLGSSLYFVAFTLLLLRGVVGRRGFGVAGIAFFVLGLAIHTAAIGVRWWLVEKSTDSWFYSIPIKNQFESVLMSAWFGALVGLALELWKGKGFFGAAAAFVGWLSLVALFASPYVFGTDLGGEITQAGGILMSYWLYVHVTVVVASYALIGMTFLLGVTYGVAKLSRAGGPLLSLIDQTNVVLLQLAFWLLGFGIVCGAVWADVSWGRPWGWDPKETFALVTWLVYLIIVHVRFVTPRHKAGWTAALSVVGFFVMLFNWIGVNFFLVGLHSYA